MKKVGSLYLPDRYAKNGSNSLVFFDQRELIKRFFELPPADIDHFYKLCGRSSRILSRQLMVDISAEKLASRLADHSIALSKSDRKKAGMARWKDEQPEERLWDNFNPEALMQEAIESDLDPSVFEDMDVRDLVFPKNILDWVIGPDMLDANPFPRQLQMMLGLTEEWCPWCSDKKFVADMHTRSDGEPWTVNQILERVTLFEHGVCPKCKHTYVEALDDPSHPHCAPTEIDVCAGQRSGKTIMSSMIMSYQDALTVALPGGPQRFYGEDPATDFYCLITALNLSQAEDTLWGAYTARKRTSPWFRNYHAWLDDHGQRLGIELYRIRDTYHRYEQPRLTAQLKPPFAKALRGRTSYQDGIDEIGMFAKEEGSVRANADEVHKSLKNSLLTLRSASMRLLKRGVHTPPRGPLICISSPWELLDKIMTLVRTADRDPTRVAYHYPTWEINPRIKRNDPDIIAAYLDDPIGAERDFGAVPPMATDPFHSNPAVIDSLIKSDLPQVFVQKTKQTASAISGKQFTYVVPNRLRPDKITPRIITLDAGESNNSFVIGVYSLACMPAPATMVGEEIELDDFDDDDDDALIVKAAEEAEAVDRRKQGLAAIERAHARGGDGNVYYLRCDGILEAQPQTSRSGMQVRVHFKRMYERALLPLLKALNVVCVVSDRWNVTQIMQSIEELDIPTHQYSLKWNEFAEFRGKVSSREVLLPPPEREYATVLEDYESAVRGAPNLHLLVQLKTVRQVGRQVTKPRGGTDDIYRTMVLAHHFAFNEDCRHPISANREKSDKPYFELLKAPGKAEYSARAAMVVVSRPSMARGVGGNSGGKASASFTRMGGMVSRGGGGGGGGGKGSSIGMASRRGGGGSKGQ